MKKIIITKFLVLSVIFVFAAEPNGYYNSAEGKSNDALRIALYEVITSHTVLSYTPGLWNLYQYSDITPDGKIWDMYSTCDWTFHTDQCGNYNSICDCYNREHSVPQSWFNEASPMVSDAFHIYPTDGRVNGHRSNFPFGECSGGTKIDSKELGRLGASSFDGYSGTVFEPIDEYKGDFARTYFYMATCYADKNFTHEEGNAVFSYSGTDNLKCNLTNYAVNLFLKWHRDDPVSQKEIDRNNAVFEYQENRNPFIDYPELAEYIWGNQVGNIWHENSSIENIDVFQPQIFPNPASEFILINDNDVFQNFDYQISTIQGKIILQDKSSVNQHINISDISSGIYFIKIYTENRYFIEKIIVK